MNYNERRQALLLAFQKPIPASGSGSTGGESTTPTPTTDGVPPTPQGKKNIFCKLKEQNQDLLQLVMSFI